MSQSPPPHPAPPGIFTRKGLEAIFSGWVPVSSFDKEMIPPAQQGVYILFRDSLDPPRFLERSPAGRHKGRDPTEVVEILRSQWVENAHVIYIGKADLRWGRGDRTSTELRKRVNNYVRHGRGRNAGHWGGRYAWQLADSTDLEVAWMVTPGDPRAMEKRLLNDFVAAYGKLPFANVKH